MRATAIPRRAAVTLIELLIVMLIIAILASLSLSAVFTVREAQMKNFTEALINKLASAMDGQWKAQFDQIREEPVPAWAVTMAGGDPRRAKVIYVKARLKQEFPVSFYQAYRPNFNYTPTNTGQFQTTTATDLPPKDTYQRLLKVFDPSPLMPASGGAIPTLDVTYDPATGGQVALPAGFEASALLYLTLSQGRRGQAGFNPDEHVEPTAIRTQVVTARVGSTYVTQQFKYFVDSWGNPVRLWTFPFGNDELNQAPYRNSFVQNQQSADAQDPDRAMVGYLEQGGQTWPPRFKAMLYPPTSSTSDLRVLTPVIGSAGRDGVWGVDYFLMTSDGSGADNDNIYSYRLRRSGARGD
jgi:prepilin-type N-terminal cleavage/methylation domain-containing protein